jgi:guanylate kinase
MSGPSGVGKGTLKDHLLRRLADVKYSVSATTRPPRAGEVQGEHYFFWSKPKFEEMIAREEFLEWAFVYQHYYGTPRRFVVDNLEQGYDVLLEIDIQGAQKVKEHFPQGVFIFIAPPTLAELADRLIKRGKDSQETIENRLSCYNQEMAQIGSYDYVVINDEVNSTVDRLTSIITAERCKVVRFTRGDDY